MYYTCMNMNMMKLESSQNKRKKKKRKGNQHKEVIGKKHGEYKRSRCYLAISDGRL